MTSFRAAVVQAAAAGFDLEAGLVKVARLTRQASEGGVALAVFPEAFLPALRGITFGTVVGDRTAEGRDHFRRYWEASVDVPGPAVDRLAGIASENSLHLVIGVVERDGGTLYCTALLFSPERYLGKHRKLMPTAAERIVWGFDAGPPAAFDMPLGRIGAVICWENYMPLLRMAMYAKGVQIYCAATADGRETWLSTVRHVALEGRCYVLSCNQFTTRSDFPSDIPDFFSGCRARRRGEHWRATRSSDRWPGSGRPGAGRGGDPLRRHRSRRDRTWQVRLRRSWPLCATGRVPADRERGIAVTGRSDQSPPRPPA